MCVPSTSGLRMPARHWIRIHQRTMPGHISLVPATPAHHPLVRPLLTLSRVPQLILLRPVQLAAPSGDRPLLLYLPGSDGTGASVTPQLPGLMEAGFDIRCALTLTRVSFPFPTLTSPRALFGCPVFVPTPGPRQLLGDLCVQSSYEPCMRCLWRAAYVQGIR